MVTLSGRLGVVSVLTCLANAVLAAEPAQVPREDKAGNQANGVQMWVSSQFVGSDDKNGENQLVFSTNSAGPSAAMERMRTRLKDPEQRPALRAEQRASIQEQHPDVARVLGISPATVEKLVESLTDQQMERLDGMYSDPDRGTTRPFMDSIQAQADAETRRLDTLRELLGEAGLERYQDYSTTLGERMQASRFDAHLDSSNRLQPEQKDRLIALLREQNLREREQSQRSGLSSLSFALRDMVTPTENRQQTTLLRNIELNEAALRRMLESNRIFSERAAGFLTPAQLAVFSQVNAERANSQRQWVERTRVQAGLNPAIPESPEVVPGSSAPQRIALAGNVKMEITLTVNRNKPTTFTHIGSNGAPVTFEAAEGLFVEATPTLFNDHWLDVQLTYYEQGPTGKRRLAAEGGFGTLTMSPDGSPSRGGGGGTLVTGSKAYAIETTATASAL
jgi:hypothetical protein